MALIKLVGKTFAVRRKSMKTMKVFFRIGFVVYGMRFSTYKFSFISVAIFDLCIIKWKSRVANIKGDLNIPKG